MSIDASIDKAVREALDRIETRIVEVAIKALDRPSSRLRPELTKVDLPEGCRAFSWVEDDRYGARKRHYTEHPYPYPVWRASYGDVVAYSTHAEGALDEFDWQMTRGPYG